MGVKRIRFPSFQAILCCERHLLLSKEMNDHVGEGRAFYNLGNVYHARGKQLGKDQVSPSDAGDFPPEVRDALTLATEYYRANLQVSKKSRPKAPRPGWLALRPGWLGLAGWP